MRKNFGTKPWVYPMPVFIIAAYDENGKANIMNAAWGGISEEDQIMICLSADHKTTKNIELSKAFTVSPGTAKQVKACDYVGIVSGNDEPNKTEKSGFTVSSSEFVNAPIINELPMALECELISYNSETCILLGKIVNVSADESILSEKGKIDAEKLMPISYDPVSHSYRVIGEKVGKAFSDGKNIV